MTYHARSAPAKRLTFQTLSNKRERKARSNAKLAHEHLVELSRQIDAIFYESREIEDGSITPVSTPFYDMLKRRMN